MPLPISPTWSRPTPVSADPTAIAAELRPPVRSVDLGAPRSVHIVGIGGAGMRAIARILLAMGHRVSGSDASPSRFLDELTALGATVFVGHVAGQESNADFLTRSTAVPDTNPEVEAARANGVEVYSRAEVLASITAVRPGILVAGTHGKTTTSSMLAVVLEAAGLAPSFVIGSDVAQFGTGARWTTGAENELFVVEADESDGTFLALPGSHAIVTSLDPDHLEFYGSAQRLQAAFEVFVDSVDGTTAVCVDDPDTASLIGRAGVLTYGVAADADLRIVNVVVGADSTSFEVWWRGEPLGPASVGLPGHHNALNAAASITIALSIGVDFGHIVPALAGFAGVARRFEPRGEHLGVRFVDDYAHLPAEVEAAVATAQAGPWNRVIAAYQPHRYSRTEELGASFATSFRGVDHLVLTDIYPSGESPRAGVSGEIVYDAVTSACPELSVSWQPTLDQVAQHLASVLGPGDLCLTLGAGDLTTVPDAVLAHLRSESTTDVAWLEQLLPALADSTVLFNEPLGPHTTYRVGGAALALVEVGNEADLDALVRAAIETETPLLPVGKGSNMLVADRGFRGVALKLGDPFESIHVEAATVRLGAAVSLPVAARQLAKHSLTGFEWAVGVPGSVGGAIAMNAGGHGSDMAASVTQATVVNLRTGEQSVRLLEDLSFGYRSSSISADELVVNVTMELQPGDRAASESAISDIVRWRRDNQPGGQNAGSVFTNPENDSAGRLIDAAGGKGLRVGTASVSEKHANFFQADPNGRADDIRELMTVVAELVSAHTGVELEPETRLVGFA